MNDQELEDIQKSRNLTAPRVTLSDLLANIAGENYFTIGAACAALGQPSPAGSEVVTLCVLTLENGFMVIGEAAPASPANFDPELGRKIAKDKAIDKVWPLMGYALKERLARPDNSGNVTAETHEFMGTSAGEPEPDTGVMRSDPSHDSGEFPTGGANG